MNPRAALILLIIAGAALVLSMSLFIVDEREYALKLRFGEIVRADFEPGLHFKTPFVNTVRKFDDRVLTRNNPNEAFLTAEKKNLRVDFYVKWRITDPSQYFRSTGGDERLATSRLLEIIKDGLRAQFARQTLQEVVTADRREVIDELMDSAGVTARELGIDIIDVRVKTLDLPPDVSESVFNRMRQERARVASQLRAEGAETAERIRADADRQRTVIIAESQRDAQRIRGAGDARAADIYAEAFGRDQEFYDFWRSMQAYRTSLGRGDDVFVISPEGEFFQYLKDPMGGRDR
ncbi:protease modulator HflC [Wenzhouxiangella sp. XN24]|uniref:protease modulator HflC n=1 Tax=Wenzhouxiangella sp. XN24 TaxID=2713569 RepID=UPI0013EDDBC5|nr:protease modulator HflC [Wenzhouxiangella sp. XN24]NGX15495.1 protease modulator HflC [Wenzhouxiangella sp. XN24]